MGCFLNYGRYLAIEPAQEAMMADPRYPIGPFTFKGTLTEQAFELRG